MRGEGSGKTSTRWLVPMVLAAGFVTIALVVIVQSVTISDFDRHLALRELGERIQREVSRVHLWLEEALAEDQTISLDRDVRRPLDATIQAVASAVEANREQRWGSADLGVILDELLTRMQTIRHAVDDRWRTRGEAGRTGGDKDQAFDEVYERVLELGDQLHQESGQLAASERSRLTMLNGAVLGLLLLLFVVLAVLISRARRALEAKNVELERRVEERTRDLVHTNKSLEEARDAAEAASRTQAQFLANMSHEIRTPLNTVLGMSSLLFAEERSEERKARLRAILDSGHDLLQMLDDALQISRGELSEIRLSVERFWIQTLVQGVIDLLRGDAESSDASLIADVPETLPEVLGDRGRLRQVLTNLVSNALKFASGADVTIRVARCREADDQDQFLFEVADHGPGVPDDQHDTIFAPFHQVDASTTRRHEGVGLGLAISKQIIELHGGEIGVRNRDREGAVFWFRVPLEVAPPMRGDVDTGDGDAEGYLLVVDDNPINGRIALDLLQRLGYRGQWVDNGEEALARVDGVGDRPKALLLDCLMPGIDGYEIARRVRKQDSTLPILALTARSGPGERERALAAGMNDYLDKPLTLEKLSPFLRQWVGCGKVRPGLASATHSGSEQSVGAPSHLGRYAPALLRELVATFRQETPLQASRLVAAARRGQLTEVAEVAHRMRSSAAHLDREELALVLEKIENVSRSGAESDVLALIETIEEIVESACSDLEAFVQSASATEPTKTKSPEGPAR